MIVIMTVIMALQNISLSQVGPFFPLEATAKGVSTEMIGLTISMHPILYIIASLTMVSKLRALGHKFAFRMGFLLIVSQLSLLGMLAWVEGSAYLLTLALLA